jgi:predicted nucleotidyltransferase
MIPRLDVEPGHLALLLAVLRAHLSANIQVWAFGSRTTGSALRYSDLDLALEGPEPLDLAVIGALRDAPSESDLPFEVDLVDLRVVSAAFRDRVAAQLVRLPLQPDPA